MLGASEYGAFADAVSATATDPAVRGIVLDVDSPGGEVGGLFDLVDAIGAIKRQSAKPMFAVASEAALSAAYAIASAADRLYVSRTGEVGSVGVVAVHIDESGADAMAGLTWTLIHAGARKTDGNPHEPLSPRATAGIQADVDHLYDELIALVAANRGLGTDAIRATEAAIYRGERAVTAGLADRIGTLAQAVAAQAARLGIDIDAADAMRRGLKPDALRQTILETLAVRSEAADVLAITPQPAQPTGDSPIVKRARERAAGNR